MHLLAQGAAELGLALDDGKLAQFESYYQTLVEWNSRMNLTAIVGYEEVQVKHFLDSLTLLPALGGTLPDKTRVVDIGAGAGLPGIPLKLVQPGLPLTLLEATRKKTQFLQHAVGLLNLPGVDVLTGRAEELAHRPQLRRGFDLALARGLARLPTLLEYCLPFLRRGGVIAAWKHGGPGLKAELDSASEAMYVLGGRVRSIYPVKIEGLTDNRVVVVIEKTRETPEEYPRRPGVPRKQPL